MFNLDYMAFSVKRIFIPIFICTIILIFFLLLVGSYSHKNSEKKNFWSSWTTLRILSRILFIKEFDLLE